MDRVMKTEIEYDTEEGLSIEIDREEKKPEAQEMDDGQLKAILDNEIDNAIGYISTETTESRRLAVQFYNRDPYGTEVEGRSQIVTGEVAEAVDGALPQLMRVFTQSDEVVRFEPKAPGDEEKAKQATEYCNWVFMNENAGPIIMHDWFKDALLQKNGVIKVWWEDQTSVTKEKYYNLSEEEVALLLSDGQMEIIESEQTQIGEIPVPLDPMMVEQTIAQGLPPPQPMMQPVFSYDVKVKKIDKKGCVKIANVPPEEFLVSKKTTRLYETPFCAHRRLVTRSELIAMGFDPQLVETLQTYEDLTYTPERVARYPRGEQPDDVSIDKSMQEVETFECYIRVDKDGDGIAELRKVLYAGSEILSDEECDYIPFCSITPFPMPHKFFGQSLADRTMDLQLIKSTVTRQILDNLYLSNAARVTAVEGQVNFDDLLSVAPNSVVRVKSPTAVNPLTVPLVANQAFPMLEYMDRVQEKRTGITQSSQGLDPNILQNTTAAAVAMVQNAGAAKIELISRLFAETGVKDLFKCILHLVCKYQDKERIIRLRGKFVTIDPREWSSEYDLSINVGLGTGNQEQQMAMLRMIMEKQEAILQQFGPNNPLVSVGQYRASLGKFIESAGYKDSSAFFKEVTPEIDQMLAQPKEPQPSADMIALLEQNKLQLEMMREKAMADIQLAREKAAAQIQLDREKAAAEMQLKADELKAEIALKSAKTGVDAASRLGSF
jgi:hypothetical protein